MLFCPKCSGELDQIGLINAVNCSKCKSSYFLKIEFVEVTNENIRESENSITSEFIIAEPPKCVGIDGSFEPG